MAAKLRKVEKQEIGSRLCLLPTWGDGPFGVADRETAAMLASHLAAQYPVRLAGELSPRRFEIVMVCGDGGDRETTYGLAAEVPYAEETDDDAIEDQLHEMTAFAEGALLARDRDEPADGAASA